MDKIIKQIEENLSITQTVIRITFKKDTNIKFEYFSMSEVLACKHLSVFNELNNQGYRLIAYDKDLGILCDKSEQLFENDIVEARWGNKKTMGTIKYMPERLTYIIVDENNKYLCDVNDSCLEFVKTIYHS